MKYSLANKEFKKRNAIFGERKTTIPIQDHNLDSIKQMGSDMEDSSIIRFNDYAEEPNIHVSSKNSEANYQFIHKDRGFQSHNREGQNKFGRHNLVPNSKPSVAIIRTAASQSAPRVSYVEAPLRHLSIASNVVNVAYYNDESREQAAELKQLFLKLSHILFENH